MIVAAEHSFESFWFFHPLYRDVLYSEEQLFPRSSRPDMRGGNGRQSDGILQFNRDKSHLLGSGTWADMEKRFDFRGSPIVPDDAIHMADLMISAGLIER